MQEDSQALVFTTKILLVLQLTALPNKWLWLHKTSSFSRSPFISASSKDDDGRCFPRWAEKWLPFSKACGCTWLVDSCVSYEITRHLERPDRKKRQRTRGKRWGEKKRESSFLDPMPESGSTALSDFKCPFCEIALSNVSDLFPIPSLPLSSWACRQHIMKWED